MVLSFRRRLLLAAVAVAVYVALAWLATLAAPDGCISHVEPDGEPEVECTVLWLPVVTTGGGQ